MEMMNHIYSKEVMHYIDLLQANINRMANNSANCKAWLIALVTAGLAFSKSELLNNIWILIIPTILFFFLDCYYLGLERRFIQVENDFLKRVKENEDIYDIIYSFNIQQFGSTLKWTCTAMTSWSTIPFYSIMVICIIFISIVARIYLV